MEVEFIREMSLTYKSCIVQTTITKFINSVTPTFLNPTLPFSWRFSSVGIKNIPIAYSPGGGSSKPTSFATCRNTKAKALTNYRKEQFCFLLFLIAWPIRQIDINKENGAVWLRMGRTNLSSRTNCLIRESATNEGHQCTTLTYLQFANSEINQTWICNQWKTTIYYNYKFAISEINRTLRLQPQRWSRTSGQH